MLLHKVLFLVIFQHVASVECQNYGSGNEHANLTLTHLHLVLSVDFVPVLIGENYEMPSCHVECPWTLSLLALSLLLVEDHTCDYLSPCPLQCGLELGLEQIGMSINRCDSTQISLTFASGE